MNKEPNKQVQVTVSYTVCVTVQAPDRPLTDDEVFDLKNKALDEAEYCLISSPPDPQITKCEIEELVD